MGACRDIKRDLLIEFLNRDTLRRSVIIKYADVPGMEEFRSTLTHPDYVGKIANKQISYAQAAAPDSGYNPAPVSKAKAKENKQKEGKGKANNSNTNSRPSKPSHRKAHNNKGSSSSHSKQQETLINQHLASINNLQEQLRLANMQQSNRNFYKKSPNHKRNQSKSNNRKPKQNTTDTGDGNGNYYGGDGDEESQYEEDDDDNSDHDSWNGDMESDDDEQKSSSNKRLANPTDKLPLLGGRPIGDAPSAPNDYG